MALSTTKNALIYSAQQNETITLKMWNTSGEIVPGLNVKSTQDVFNNNDTMDVGSPNTDPDTVHEIELQAGEEVKGWCSVDDAVEFEIVTN